eukprot:CAMPEP_0197008496 /NCGR_PEP_ID=MMETSP1380-20130617/45523_1 /TAXON_ID=5936 /ORGANISM="Euplotes crassus, Strain CT5" /LENGTH=72 /DNA_ID=CAMNT_0042429123 /DNA_START=1088 /DNA_END=1303 /DNA_ORIENTATION=+
MAAIPTPMPTTNLPTISTGIDGVKAIITQPITKAKSATNIVIFLPNLSEIGPPVKDPIAAPNVVIETTSSFW